MLICFKGRKGPRREENPHPGEKKRKRRWGVGAEEANASVGGTACRLQKSFKKRSVTRRGGELSPHQACDGTKKLLATGKKSSSYLEGAVQKSNPPR